MIGRISRWAESLRGTVDTFVILIDVTKKSSAATVDLSRALKSIPTLRFGQDVIVDFLSSSDVMERYPHIEHVTVPAAAARWRQASTTYFYMLETVNTWVARGLTQELRDHNFFLWVTDSVRARAPPCVCGQGGTVHRLSSAMCARARDVAASLRWSVLCSCCFQVVEDDVGWSGSNIGTAIAPFFNVTADLVTANTDRHPQQNWMFRTAATPEFKQWIQHDHEVFSTRLHVQRFSGRFLRATDVLSRAGIIAFSELSVCSIAHKLRLSTRDILGNLTGRPFTAGAKVKEERWADLQDLVRRGVAEPKFFHALKW